MSGSDRHPAGRSNPFDPGYFDTTELRDFGFAAVGENVKIARNCTIIGLQNIRIGNDVRIDGQVVIAAHTGSLVLGDHIHIGGSCYLGCAGGIELADFAGLSQGVRIYSATDDYSGGALTNPTVPHGYLKLKVGPVVLGRHAIVGSGSVILPKIAVGEGVAVGALSLVTKSLPDWGIYAGTPARRIHSRSKELLAFEARLLAERTVS
ncbi:MAG: acyltransferase [Gammaproteobacteria bacterium]|nr:acyltransferase [Gammaproteobacteria bacterium]